MSRKPKLLIEQLRDAIKESGLTANAIGVRAGIHPTSITRFMKGERSISIEVAEKIADHLGYELRKK